MVRLVLIWLLLAVPLQGMAAVARLHCASGDVRATGPVALHAAPATGVHDHAAHIGHHTPDAGVDTDGSASHRCSACAACCPVLGLPARAVLLPASPPGLPPPVAVVASRESFVPFGLDRPPRRACR